MPGIVIHIACAKEYIRKHKNEIKNIDRFIKGTIEPDIASKKKVVLKGLRIMKIKVMMI